MIIHSIIYYKCYCWDNNKNKPHINNIIINKEILNLFDFSKYNVNDDDIFVVIHILNTMLVQSIGIALKNNDINKIRNMYIKEIDLILKGIERGNVWLNYLNI